MAVIAAVNTPITGKYPRFYLPPCKTNTPAPAIKFTNLKNTHRLAGMINVAVMAVVVPLMAEEEEEEEDRVQPPLRE